MIRASLQLSLILQGSGAAAAAVLLGRKSLEARPDRTNLDLPNPQPSGSPADK